MFSSAALADSHLPQSPQYLNDFSIALSKAEQFAYYCDDIDFDQEAVQRIYSEIDQRLIADGITQRPIVDAVIFPPSEESDAIMEAWLNAIRARGNPEVEFCKASEEAIEANDAVAAFLIMK